MTDPQCGARVMVETEWGPRPGTIDEVTVLGEGESRTVFVRVLLDEPLPPVCVCQRGPVLRTTAAPEQVHPLH